MARATLQRASSEVELTERAELHPGGVGAGGEDERLRGVERVAAGVGEAARVHAEPKRSGALDVHTQLLVELDRLHARGAALEPDAVPIHVDVELHGRPHL